MRLSILDQAPNRRGGAPGHAFRDTLALVQLADRLGYERYWVSEHHAIDTVAITAPEVVIGMLGQLTSCIRVGSGGILLPNHRPIHVAEQFRSLEALHPGRIDLGIGRAEGALDPATVQAFGRPADNAHGAGFEEQLDELLAFGGVRPLPPEHPLASVVAGPADVPLPPVFLLGSSVNSAGTAARRGLGYGFAAPMSPDAVGEALRRYRAEFVPARAGDRPHAILALNVMTGVDDEHAAALAEPAYLALVQARLGRPARLLPVEEALAHAWTEEERAAAERFVKRRADVTGGPERVRRELEAAVAATGADEVIAICNTYDPDERQAAVTRLAEAMELSPPRP